MQMHLPDLFLNVGTHERRWFIETCTDIAQAGGVETMVRIMVKMTVDDQALAACFICNTLLDSCINTQPCIISWGWGAVTAALALESPPVMSLLWSNPPPPHHQSLHFLFTVVLSSWTQSSAFRDEWPLTAPITGSRSPRVFKPKDFLHLYEVCLIVTKVF